MKIICKIEMFQESPIFLVDDNGSSRMIGVTSLGRDAWNELAAACEREEVYSLHLFGAQNIVETIAEEIKTTIYSNKRIDIEVN